METGARYKAGGRASQVSSGLGGEEEELIKGRRRMNGFMAESVPEGSRTLCFQGFNDAEPKMLQEPGKKI